MPRPLPSGSGSNEDTPNRPHYARTAPFSNPEIDVKFRICKKANQ